MLERNRNLVFAIACTPKATCPPTIAPSPIRPAATRRRTRSRSAPFNDRTGIRCGSHQQPLQTYTRDTGELMHDLSVPIFIHGKHWAACASATGRRGAEPQAAAPTGRLSLALNG